MIDPILIKVGRWTSWLWLLLLITIVANVILRYVFGEGRIEFEEFQWHIYATGFLLGLSYAYQDDAHIRVDVIHEHLSLRLKAWIELYGIALFLLPFIAVIVIYSVPFVWTAYEFGEISQAPGGLPFRWVIKSMLPAGFCLLLLAVVSRFSRVWSFLFIDAGVDHGGE